MKANRWIVFVFIGILLATLIMTVNLATATTPDKPVSGDVTPAANPGTTDWMPDQQVSHTADDEVHPSIATAGDGSLWVAYEHHNTVTDHWEIAVEKSTDGGVTWTLMLTHSITGFDLHVPSIAVDVYTNWVYVAYQRDYSTTDHDIHLLYFNGTSWQLIYVDQTSSDDYSPSIVIEYSMGTKLGGNYVFITWERHVSSTDIELEFAYSHDHGATWPTKYALTSHGAGELTDQPSMTLTVNSNYEIAIYIAYRDCDLIGGNYRIGLLTSTDEGVYFVAPQNITSWGSSSVHEPSITAIHGGTVVVAAWIHAHSSTDDDIQYGYSQDNGVTWYGPFGMAASNSNEINPHLTVDGMGRTTSLLGNIHATYEILETVGSRTNGIYYTKANYASPTSWSTAVQVADDNAHPSASYPNVADRTITTVYDSVPVIVWTDLRNPTDQIYATTKLPVHLVVRGGDNRIYYHAYSSGAWASGSWNSLPSGTTIDTPAAAVASDKLYFVVRGSDGTSLWFSSTSLPGSSFSGWTHLSGSTPSTPTLTSNGTTLALVVRGGDDRIYYCFYTIAWQTWTAWSALPSGTTKDIPAATLAGNTLHIVVRGSDGTSLWYCNINPTTSVFSGWSLLSGSTPSPPTLTSANAALTLVVRGGDDRIYYRTYTIASKTWTAWSALPSGTTQDSPAATILGNILWIVVRGSDGTSLWQSSINLATSVFSGWTLLSGSTPSRPTLTS